MYQFIIPNIATLVIVWFNTFRVTGFKMVTKRGFTIAIEGEAKITSPRDKNAV